MKSIVIGAILFIISCGLLQSQNNTSPVLVTWGGGSTMINSGQVDWSLGQVAIRSIRSGETFITQGFHQPDLTLVGTGDLARYEIHLFPNPADNVLYVEGEGDDVIDRCEILDVHGHLIKSKKVEGRGTISLSVEPLHRGHYYLRLTIGEDVVYASFIKH